MLPLEGVRVLTVEEKLPVTYCSMLLGDLGADVIILERPGVGNPARGLPHFLDIINRNKRSITINLKSEKGKEVCYKLVKECDVLMECMRPGVVKRLRIDYETIKNINPQLIYCSVSGYGQNGPYRDWPAHDLSCQGVAGILNFTPQDSKGVPFATGIAMADLSAAMFSAIAILSSLLLRSKSGHGQYIDVSLTEGLVSWLSVQLGTYFNTGLVSQLIGDPGFNVFATKDNKCLTLSIAHEDYFWHNLCHAIEKEELADIPREQRWQLRDELTAMLKEVFSGKTRDEWVKLLTQANVPCAPVLSLEEVANDPQFQQRGLIFEAEDAIRGKSKQIAYPTKFSEMQPEIRRSPPTLGEHTMEILTSLGYTTEEVEELQKGG